MAKNVPESVEPPGPSLVRALGTWDVSLITIGMIVGSAIFFAASIAPRELPQPTLLIGVWCAGGLLSLAGVVTYAELGTMFPKAGGQYHFLKEAYGPLYGFLFGWTSFLVIQCGGIAYLAVASELGRVCLVASKLAADLRLLSSGPHGGLGEAVLPAVQAGSTIMPGKVNPVIPELVLQVGFEVEGARRVVDAAAGAGELELNVMEPAIAASLLPALEKVGRTAVVFAERCLDGLTWDEERMRANLGGSLAARVLDAQTSGYEAAARAAKPHDGRLA